MKVLVVHDRKSVGDRIVEVATENFSANVEFVEDAVGARGAMTASYFDLLILDLTIPNIKDRGEPNYQPAEALLEELFTPGQILTPANILGITRERDALTRINSTIGAHLMAIIEEDDDGHWEYELKDRLSYVSISQKARTTAWLTKHDYDLLIITALDKELKPLRDLFELRETAALPGVYEFVFNDRHGRPRRGSCSAIGRAGQPSAASEAQGLICQLRPKLALMIGFCGGVPGKGDLGDILFGEIAIDWDYGKWKPTTSATKLYARPEPISIRNSRAHLLARRMVEANTAGIDGLADKMFAMSKGEITKPKMALTPFASGSAVIGDPQVLDSIRSLNDNVGGVDMESYGFYYASHYSRAAKPDFLCVKAVADDCSPEKDDRLHEVCCYAAAQVARHIIAVEWDF